MVLHLQCLYRAYMGQEWLAELCPHNLFGYSAWSGVGGPPTLLSFVQVGDGQQGSAHRLHSTQLGGLHPVGLLSSQPLVGDGRFFLAAFLLLTYICWWFQVVN